MTLNVQHHLKTYCYLLFKKKDRLGDVQGGTGFIKADSYLQQRRQSKIAKTAHKLHKLFFFPPYAIWACEWHQSISSHLHQLTISKYYFNIINTDKVGTRGKVFERHSECAPFGSRLGHRQFCKVFRCFFQSEYSCSEKKKKKKKRIITKYTGGHQLPQPLQIIQTLDLHQ